LRGTRTALMCQLAIAATEPASFGPSKMPQPWMQAYSVPERSTPSTRIGCPAALSSRLPDARSARPVGGGGAGVGVRVGAGVGVGLEVGVGVDAGVGVGVTIGVADGVGRAVPLGCGVSGGVSLGTEVLTVGEALTALVPLPGATVAGCVLRNSKKIKTRSALTTPAMRNTFTSSLRLVDDRPGSDPASKRPPLDHGSVAVLPRRLAAALLRDREI
jgi:hypothetical protein